MIEGRISLDPLELDRTAELVAAGVVLVLWALAFWAAGVDWASQHERSAAALDSLSIIYKLVAVGSLTWLGRRLRSRSLWLLALLLALLTVGSLLVNADWFASWEHRLADSVERVVPAASRFLGLGGLFAVLAVIAGVLVWAAYRNAASDERPAVVRIILILFVVGIFLGPVNAISSLGINREWLFAEDFGQVMSLAVLAGYSVGLTVAIRGRSATST